ncbi:MAG: hypothetical protein B6I24_00880 [Bacteroidetes bacterium 4572_128]|nr:MAG: hypothetical protein B6I24_00880 [Bacteroidetes bacterium 4572_128]
MKKLIYDLLLILIFFTFFSKKIFSQNGIFFSENKGQWHKNVLYKTHFDNVSFYIEKDCFTFDISEKENHHHKKITKKDSIFKKRIKHHSYKVLFENSNPNKKIFAKKLQKSYENFFLGKDKNKWASYVQSYEDVFYENIYKNIDLKVYSQASFLKYDFIINPKGKVSDISFIYKGLYEIRIENDNLILKTSLNEITELKPYSYQIIGKDTFAIKCKFNLDKNKNRLSFIVKNYDKNFPLIIDPILVFSTYSGSGSDDLYPVNLGAYDISYNGSWDIGIIKYDANGTNRLFATYIGGDRNDLPHSLVVNSQNELFIYGSTGSTNFPTTENAFDDSFAGGTAVFSSSIYNEFGTDIYVSRISEDGSELLASTYIGGSLNDGFNTANVLAYNYGDNARGEIIIDKEDDVYLATYTYSDDFPTTTNAFQNSSNGNMEGLVLKLNPNLTDLIWSTYVGGDEDDCIYSIDIDSNNDVFVTGGTRSENFPITYGTYNSNYNGGEADAFIMKFNQNGNLIRSTFFGSEFYDQAYFIKLDANNNVYITGQTKAEGNTLIFNADYSIPNSGQFITKFNPSLTEIIYSTVFGLGDGEPNLSITAFTVDVCNRVYLSSWGREWPSPIYGTQIINGAVHLNVFLGYDWESITGTNGMEITEYATYFGEIHYDDCSISGRDHVDGGTSRFDKKGNIYQAVCASCGGCQGFPTTENVWSETNNSSNCNNAVFKFNLERRLAFILSRKPKSHIYRNRNL